MDGITRPYEGTEPYIFVSYSHKNSGRVNQIIEALNREGYRIWYDAGISPGSQYLDVIARHIEKCTVFLLFLSSESAQSDDCIMEIGYAPKGTIIPVHIERNIMLPPGLSMKLKTLHYISLYPRDPIEKFLRRLEVEPAFRPCQGKQELVQPKPELRKDPKEKSLKCRLSAFFKSYKVYLLIIAIFAIVLAIILAIISIYQHLFIYPRWNLEEGTLTISKAIFSAGGMPDYKWDYNKEKSTAPWIKGLDPEQKILDVVIQDGITSIGSYAFYDCAGLTKIMIPDGVTKIDNYTFARCRELANVALPAGLQIIGASAFRDCASLNDITIPYSVTTISSNAFAGCTSLTSVFIPDGVTEIRDDAFFNCVNLTEASVPADLVLSDRAFPEYTNIVRRQ